MAEITYRTNANLIEFARSQIEELRRNPSNDPGYDENLMNTRRTIALRPLFGYAEPGPIRPDPNASASTPAPPPPAPAYRERGGASADDDIEYDPESSPWTAAYDPESTDFKPEEEDIPEPANEVEVETYSHGEEANEYKIDVDKADSDEGDEHDEYRNAELTPYYPD